MLDSHKLWESILFEKWVEEHLIARFVDRAEYMSAEVVKPYGTDVVRSLLISVKDNILRDISIDSVYGLDEILEKELSDALSNIPEFLVVEVTEHVYEELPPEQEDVVKWDVDVG